MATTRRKYTRRATTKKAAVKKAAPKVAAPALAGAKITLGPLPLRSNEQLTITAEGLPRNAQARVTITPEGTQSGDRMLKTDPFGQLQTHIVPRAGAHSVVVEMESGTIKRDFDVAE